MFVDEISLNDFRNYEKGYALFSRGLNVIYGGNARGKTNILEAVYLLSAARSHRLARENEMIRFGCRIAKITAKFSSRGRDNIGEISIFSDKKKQIKINKAPIDKTSELIGYLNAVMFCPEDLRLVKGSPKERRRMLDLGICQVSKRYFHSLSQYLKALDQRNRLLKENPDSKTLWVWDERLAEYGSDVIRFRKNYVDSLCERAAAVHHEICGETLEIRYKCGVSIEDFSDREIIKNQFCCDIKKNSDRERRFGISLTGPHRDDFDIVIDGREARLYGSQGQQRTAALSLKMGEVGLIRDNIGEPPVLLLDDVMSELDQSRQKYILENIKDIQVIITSTERLDFDGAEQIYVEDVKR